MHSAALLMQENASQRRSNEKKRQKCTQSNHHIADEVGLTTVEALQLSQHSEQPVEDSQVVLYGTDESVNLADLPRQMAPSRCSGL